MREIVAKMKSNRKPVSLRRKMKHKLWFNNTQNFAYMQLVGELSMDDIERLFSVLIEVFTAKNRHYLLIDVRLSQGLLSQKEIRNSFRERSLDVGLDRIAVLGASHANRMTLKILLSVLGKTNVSRFCSTEREALTWLKESSR